MYEEEDKPRLADFVSALRAFILEWEQENDRPRHKAALTAKTFAKQRAEKLASHPYLRQ